MGFAGVEGEQVDRKGACCVEPRVVVMLVVVTPIDYDECIETTVVSLLHSTQL
jgi:hypothetical protein